MKTTLTQKQLELEDVIFLSSQEDVLRVFYSETLKLFFAKYNGVCICSTKNIATLNRNVNKCIEQYNLHI